MKKKGFTLIELLATIIVLALIGLIVYPTLNNVISNNKNKLYDEQIKDLLRHANTWLINNADTVILEDGETYYLTFDQLYKAGFLQSKDVKNPKTNENLEGCISVISDSGNYETVYNEQCSKVVTLKGNIKGKETELQTENYDKVVPVKGKVQLIKDNKIVYETNTDSSGNYKFLGIVPDTYLLLVSQPNKTKYGEKISLIDNTIKDMDVVLQYGDFDGDNIVGYGEKVNLLSCFGYKISEHPECVDSDLTKDERVDGRDLSVLVGNFGKVSKITIDNETHTVSGKVTTDRAVTYNRTFTIRLTNGVESYSAQINEDGTFNIENVKSGFYYVNVNTRNGNGAYSKFIIVDNDVDLNIHLYYGSFTNGNILSKLDVDALNDVILELAEYEEYYDSYEEFYEYYKAYDMNEDGTFDSKDLEILNSNIEKSNEQMKTDYCF